MLEHHGITTTIQTDEEDNLILDFPTEILEALNWGEGDTLDIQVFAGRVVFSKVHPEGVSDSDFSNGTVSEPL